MSTQDDTFVTDAYKRLLVSRVDRDRPITAIVQIGNSDDKLPQCGWARFFSDTSDLVKRYSSNIYFFGSSLPDSDYQNAAFIFEIYLEERLILMDKLSSLCGKYSQDSIAWTEGSTTFIRN